MDLRLDPDEEQFRREVRTFVAAQLPADLARRNRGVYHPTREDTAHWMAILHARGWSAPSWPVEHGGTGWSLARQLIFAEECYAAGAPKANLQGLNLVGPVLYTYGSPEQRARHLPGILRGEVHWAQGFSEPDAGSDLAALRTRARRDGADYVVNGQKIWTSDAHKADWCFCLVRTDADARPQRGISFLLVDMKTPGISVRPIASIDDGLFLNEVFFDQVSVPVANLVGEENSGWTYAKQLLGVERAFSAADLPYCNHQWKVIVRLAQERRRDGLPLIKQGDLASRLARLRIDIQALRFSTLRLISDASPEDSALLASVLKVRGGDVQQRLSQVMLEVIGEYGVVRYSGWDRERDGFVGPAEAPGVAADYFYRRAVTIFGGSTEIQRNIIAKTILAL